MRAKVRAVIDKWAERPFFYGQDCCQFAGEVVEAITGSNPMSAFNYADETEAYEIIDGYGGLYQAVMATLGEPGLAPPKDGDVTIYDLPNGLEVVGVVYGDRSVLRTENGVVDLALSRAKAVWSV